MSPRLSLWLAAGSAAVISVCFAWFVRLPLPFVGFAIVVAAVLAFLLTLCFVAWMPATWAWTDNERLRHAFKSLHGVTNTTASLALEAIQSAHTRATVLRQSALVMRTEVSDDINAVADRLDAAAREIFYAPDRLRDLRAVLVRSELIEDAALAHKALRQRGHEETEENSRQKLRNAVQALDAAFDQTDLMAARGLLAEVETASAVAETVLKPRQPLARTEI